MGNDKIIEKDKTKKYNKISDYEKYTTNPFINNVNDSLLINKTRKTVAYGSTSLTIINDLTGEIVPEKTMISRYTKEVDEETFVKIYLNMIKELLFLPSNSIKVLAYLMSSIKINNDIILFDREECIKFTGLSEARIYDGLSKLLENQIIARRTNPYQYYINPTAFFNGNRLVLVKEYIKQPKINKVNNQMEIFDNNIEENKVDDL